VIQIAEPSADAALRRIVLRLNESAHQARTDFPGLGTLPRSLHVHDPRPVILWQETHVDPRARVPSKRAPLGDLDRSCERDLGSERHALCAGGALLPGRARTVRLWDRGARGASRRWRWGEQIIERYTEAAN